MKTKLKKGDICTLESLTEWDIDVYTHHSIPTQRKFKRVNESLLIGKEFIFLEYSGVSMSRIRFKNRCDFNAYVKACKGTSMLLQWAFCCLTSFEKHFLTIDNK